MSDYIADFFGMASGGCGAPSNVLGMLWRGLRQKIYQRRYTCGKSFFNFQTFQVGQ